MPSTYEDYLSMDKSLSLEFTMEVFEDARIRKHLKVMQQVGLSYLTGNSS